MVNLKFDFGTEFNMSILNIEHGANLSIQGAIVTCPRFILVNYLLAEFMVLTTY